MKPHPFNHLQITYPPPRHLTYLPYLTHATMSSPLQQMATDIVACALVPAMALLLANLCTAEEETWTRDSLISYGPKKPANPCPILAFDLMI